MSLNDVWNLALALTLTAFLAGVVRLAFATPGERRTVARVAGRALVAVLRGSVRYAGHVLLLAWVLATWRRVTRNLGIAYTNKYVVKRTRTTDRRGVMTEREHPKVTYPHLLARPDAYGVVLTVWTRVGIARADFEAVTEHLANVWRCRRVHIEQHRPGRLTVRALRRDPLTAGLSLPIPTTPDPLDLEGGGGDARTSDTAAA